eukprot:TRINITY_DN10399_c0_g3_i1.p1 TRINITY_DN10399_c0_g3~~TRINITY_DN10399_c0_g3_i1.p1  ORF type:complete len:511 (+),score=69.38 TRINITY_DN10399_c0_g3_i1:44-1534(+)
MRKSLALLQVPMEKSNIGSFKHSGYERRGGGSPGKGMMPGTSGRGFYSKETEYYGGGKSIQEHANQVKAEAWKSLRKDAIKVSRQPFEADIASFASSLPLQRQKKTQTLIDWENIQMELPKIGQTISSRKSNVVNHLLRLRSNPKYRHKQEKFTVRSSEAILQLFQRGVKPDLLLLNPQARVPNGISLEKMPTVLATPEIVSIAAGEGHTAMIAEYIMPEEEDRQQLWLSPKGSIKRAAVFVGIQSPGQLGEQIRSAVALGCDAILLGDNCVDAYSQEVIDASMAANVTVGGYPRFHVLREEHGDDMWGILNRMISHHEMLPVLSATNNEDMDAASTADELWRGMQTSGDIDRPMCLFFGDKKHGLDIDYCHHNLDTAAALVKAPTGFVGLPASSQAALVMNSLMEPTFVSALPPAPISFSETKAAKVRLITPISREIANARIEGRVIQTQSPSAPTMRVSKFYKQRSFGQPAYKTEISTDLKKDFQHQLSQLNNE